MLITKLIIMIMIIIIKIRIIRPTLKTDCLV